MSQTMKAVCINFDNIVLMDLWSLTAENSTMKYMRVQNSYIQEKNCTADFSGKN